MADMPDIGDIANFDKAKLKKTEIQEKNTLPTKETTEQEKRSEIS
ncbi:thymosin beta-10-like [Meriones unguiculatus]|nr:thymosin beta-10-like [Meriones unguiculatus]